jgi:hypothetical protein
VDVPTGGLLSAWLSKKLIAGAMILLCLAAVGIFFSGRGKDTNNRDRANNATSDAPKWDSSSPSMPRAPMAPSVDATEVAGGPTPGADRRPEGSSARPEPRFNSRDREEPSYPSTNAPAITEVPPAWSNRQHMGGPSRAPSAVAIAPRRERPVGDEPRAPVRGERRYEEEEGIPTNYESRDIGRTDPAIYHQQPRTSGYQEPQARSAQRPVAGGGLDERDPRGEAWTEDRGAPRGATIPNYRIRVSTPQRDVAPRNQDPAVDVPNERSWSEPAAARAPEYPEPRYDSRPSPARSMGDERAAVGRRPAPREADDELAPAYPTYNNAQRSTSVDQEILSRAPAAKYSDMSDPAADAATARLDPIQKPYVR